MIPVPAGLRIWIATGHTDMRRGMRGLELQVQEGLGRDPFAGDVFVFPAAWHKVIGVRTPSGRTAENSSGRKQWTALFL